MKKLFKIAGIALLSLIGLLLAIFLLARFVFREQAIDYLTGLEKQQRVELLRAAGPYAADTVVRALPERRWDFCGRHTWHFGGDAPRRCLPGLQAVFLLPGGGDASGLWQPDGAIPLHPTGTGIFYFGFL